MGETLRKNEKLKSKKLIEQLFAEGKRVKSFPFQLIYLPADQSSEMQLKVGFSVPKRIVKRAVDRNRIKRMMREVYRKNKKLFTKDLKEPYIFMLIYSEKKEIKYTDLELAIEKISSKFLKKITKDEEN